ncbi:hypothetical protein MN608_01192 [Microdochium nivale]|nr:hypothetical protein MN608_01192 [Microdochium nivale]
MLRQNLLGSLLGLVLVSVVAGLPLEAEEPGTLLTDADGACIDKLPASCAVYEGAYLVCLTNTWWCYWPSIEQTPEFYYITNGCACKYGEVRHGDESDDSRH